MKTVLFDIGVHRAQELSLLTNSSVKLLFNQLLICCYRSLKKGELFGVLGHIYTSVLVWLSLGEAKKKVQSMILIGIDPLIQYNFAKRFNIYDQFFNVALTRNKEKKIGFSHIHTAVADKKGIGSSLFKKFDNAISRPVVSVDSEYFFEFIKAQLELEGSEYVIIVRLNCEGAEGHVLNAAIKVFGGRLRLVLGTIDDVGKIFGPEEQDYLSETLKSVNVPIVPFSSHQATWLPAIKALKDLV